VLKRRYRIIIPILLLFCLFGGGFSSLATEAPEPVAFVELSNLSYPVAGESPDFEVSVSGAVCSPEDIRWFSHKDEKYLDPGETFAAEKSYTLELTLTPEEGFVFAGEPGATSLFGVSGIFLPPADETQTKRILTYEFTAATSARVTVTTDLYPQRGGTVTSGGEFAAGDTVTLSARPEIGYVFVNWSTADDRIVSTAPTFSFTALEDIDLLANFSAVELTRGDCPVIFTESSAAVCEGRMTLDLVSMAALDEGLAAAVKNGTVNIQWYKNEKPLPHKNGESFDFTAIDVGHSFFVQVVYGDRFSASEVFTVETKPFDLDVTRIYGSDRYETALAVADQQKLDRGISQFDAVIIASGTQFADALSGSYLAHVKNAPILLTRANQTTESMVLAYVKENLAPGGTVYILGGPNAVPVSTETGLEGFEIKRLGGADRYETNLRILSEAGPGEEGILICTGLDFADSLSASASKLPILLVKNSLTEDQKALLAQVPGTKYIIGGTAAVSARVEAQLSAFGQIRRIGGADRFETSVLVAREFFTSPEGAVLAYARNFPDGLSGGPLAICNNSPLILTASGKEAPAAAYVGDKDLTRGYVLGGSGLISDKTVGKIFPTVTQAQEWNLILVNPWNPLLSGHEVTLKYFNSSHSVDGRIIDDLQAMMDGARSAGLDPVICSSYRTVDTQKRLFAAQVAKFVEQGYSLEAAEERAAMEVAVPGTSEHHTGLAVDIVARSYQMLDKNQENTAEQKWLMANSWRYGFILRYPNGSTDITGIIYEPWHYRYVGKTAAEEIYTRGITLEEYLEDYYG